MTNSNSAAGTVCAAVRIAMRLKAAAKAKAASDALVAICQDGIRARTPQWSARQRGQGAPVPILFPHLLVGGLAKKAAARAR